MILSVCTFIADVQEPYARGARRRRVHLRRRPRRSSSPHPRGRRTRRARGRGAARAGSACFRCSSRIRRTASRPPHQYVPSRTLPASRAPPRSPARHEALASSARRGPSASGLRVRPSATIRLSRSLIRRPNAESPCTLILIGASRPLTCPARVSAPVASPRMPSTCAYTSRALGVFAFA